MRALALAVLLLTAPALSGCLGFGSDDADEDIRKERAVVTESLGGLEGVVTDEAIAPVVGANLTLVENGLTATTVEDGSYQFSRVSPGTYTLSVNAGGYVSAQQTIAIRAGDVAVLDFVVARLFTTQPFTQQWELAGFFECGFGAGYDVSALPPPANVSGGIVSFTVCAAFNDFLGNNATNDRWEHFFEAETALESLVVETTWEPSTGALTDVLWVDLVPQGFHCGNITTCDWSLLDHWGQSPLRGEVNSTKLQAEQEFFDRRCDNGVDEWCGYSFADDGWPLWIRTWARWECQPAGPQACVIAQQPFTHYVTSFHNAPAPEGYSALS